MPFKFQWCRRRGDLQHTSISQWEKAYRLQFWRDLCMQRPIQKTSRIYVWRFALLFTIAVWHYLAVHPGKPLQELITLTWTLCKQRCDYKLKLMEYFSCLVMLFIWYCRSYGALESLQADLWCIWMPTNKSCQAWSSYSAMSYDMSYHLFNWKYWADYLNVILHMTISTSLATDSERKSEEPPLQALALTNVHQKSQSWLRTILRQHIHTASSMWMRREAGSTIALTLTMMTSKLWQI